MAVGDSYKAFMAQRSTVGSTRADLPEGEKDEHEHVETLEEVPLNKRQKLKRHLARFWCCYVLAGVIFLAIFLPVFFLVAIPAIAQRIVDDTDLPVYGANIMDPTPDSVTFTLDTSLTIPLGLSVRIDPLDLNLFNRDSDPPTDYLTVPIPEYKLKGKTEISVTSNNTKVKDESEFVKALTKAVYSKKFILSAVGETTGHLGALKTHLKLDKDVELDGLDKLNGFSIDQAALLLPAAADGTNLNGKATLPNHSVVTFALGNVTLNLLSGDLWLGTALIQNVVLKPGNNSVDLTGKLDLNRALSNIGPLLAAQKDALRSGEIELTATGNQTVYNGQHIPFFETVLNNLTISSRVSIVKLLVDTIQGFLGPGSEGVVAALSKVLNGLDIGKLFQDLDMDSLGSSLGNVVGDLDLSKLTDGVNFTQLLNSIDWTKLTDGLVSLLNQLDLGSLLKSLDLGKIISSIDWGSLIRSLGKVLRNVDVGAVLDTLTGILQKIDVPKIVKALSPALSEIDFGSILKNLDLGAIINSLATALSGVDWAAVVKNIDFAGLIDKLGPLLQAIDLPSILNNIDWSAVIDSLGNVLKNLDLGAILKNIDLGSIISGLGKLFSNLDIGSLLKNVDISGILKSILGSLKNLHLGDVLDQLTIGGINIGHLLQGLEGATNSTGNGNVSLSDALDNLENALDNLGGGG